MRQRSPVIIPLPLTTWSVKGSKSINGGKSFMQFENSAIKARTADEAEEIYNSCGLGYTAEIVVSMAKHPYTIAKEIPRK